MVPPCGAATVDPARFDRPGRIAEAARSRRADASGCARPRSKPTLTFYPLLSRRLEELIRSTIRFKAGVILTTHGRAGPRRAARHPAAPLRESAVGGVAPGG